ncbi:IclR family transcriptional regulator [Alkalihalobacillus sp. MEB130]|uniref:IclR family transcriptional regulator n=1 Tax=Alkalihalobacillus sp. MEB130 TaxID=2976704 RepID=UPI0028DE0F58|nr:IclR family transcriptional regulator [Alkalihalobacillus sp. MEB130]MDT8861354.1 IclR family transcriptional regulator [Alkalihalobacillus sp. MEB130]
MSEVIRKSIDILNKIKPSEEKVEWSVTEISRELNIPIQTVHRILSCLSEYGFVYRDNKNKRYKLGLSLMELGLSIRDNLSVRNTALPIMEQLSSDTKESVYLTVQEGSDGIFIDCIDSPHLLKIVEPIGMRRPLCVAASKKVILAFLKPVSRSLIIDELITKGYVTNEQELREQIRIIKEQGFAISYGETTEGTVSIAAPIFSWEDDVIGSISVAGPEGRFVGTRLNEIIKLTTKSACEISEELGWFARV